MWSDNETTQDLLGYQVHADLLKKIILNDAMLPISIGVFGNWGSGKSSLMLLLQQSLQELEKSQQNEHHRIILQVYFNSWQFESYDSTKLTMIESILEALDKDINERKDVFERVDDFLERINFLKAGVFVLKKAYENLTPDWLKEWFPTKDEIDKITNKDKYNNLLKDVTKGNTSKFIATFRELFEELVDDMCYKAVIVYVFLKRLGKLSILTGMLIGASVGAGFAAFESAGYALQPLMQFLQYSGFVAAHGQMLDEQQMLDAIHQSIFIRGFLAPGGHVAWAAISGAAIVIAAKDTGVFAGKKSLRLCAIPVILHGLWDCPLAGWFNNLFPFAGYITLIILVWMVVLILINMGLAEVSRESSI